MSKQLRESIERAISEKLIMFWPARLRSGYNPGLTMVTIDKSGLLCLAERSVLGEFPPSGNYD